MTRNAADELSVITVLHNSADVIEDTVAAVPLSAELVIVDNSSTDGGLERVLSVRPDAKFVVAENRGFAYGCNLGAQIATRAVFVFLNPDAIPEPGALAHLSKRCLKDVASMFGPALLDDQGRLRFICRRRSRPMDELVDLLPIFRFGLSAGRMRNRPPADAIYRDGGTVDYLQGACLALTRELFFRVGGFDESFFLYSEEEDLADRVWASGGNCVYDPTVRVRHAWGTSTAKAHEIATRSRMRSAVLLYGKRHGLTYAAFVAFVFGCALIVRSAGVLLATALGRGPERGLRWAADAARGTARGLLAVRNTRRGRASAHIAA